MPELPEVETIVRYLRPRICGRRILSMESDTPRIFRGSQRQQITNPKRIYEYTRHAVIGKKIKSVERFGKNIAFVLSSGNNLLIHLMMTGQILLNPDRKSPHDRMRIDLSGGVRLIFNDVRKFGRLRLAANPQDLVGPDPLKISLAEFRNRLRKKNGIIKSLLLNQNIISGIGNIYADETLFESKIRPERNASSISRLEAKKLYQAIIRIMQRATKVGGSSVAAYRLLDTTRGNYAREHKVYGKAGQMCVNCHKPLEKIIIQSRTTIFCPRCQK